MAGSIVGPSRIVVTGDIVRPSPMAIESHQNVNINWLHSILQWPLCAATQIEPEKLLGAPNGFEVDRFYEHFELAASQESWAKLYHHAECPPAAETMLVERLADAVVVGFELSPLLAGILDRHGIPYVNVVIHPIRFLDDIFFAISTNNLDVYRSLLTVRAPEALFFTVAGVHKAAGSRVEGLKPGQDSVLIAAQTAHDKTLIDDGRFLALEDYLEDIDGLLNRHENVLFKRHPLAPELSPELEAFLVDRRVRITDANLYTLLSDGNLTAVHSVSSSASHEAPYFGKSGEYFFQAHYDIASDDKLGFSPTRYVSVLDRVLEADFWRDILSTLLPTTAPTGSVLPVKPNRLRISMREFWGYNEVDTDVVTKLFLDHNFPTYIGRHLDDSVARHLEKSLLRYMRRGLKNRLRRYFSGGSGK